MSFYKHIFFSFTDILGHRSYRTFLSDSCTACRCALLYARRTAPRRHTGTRAPRMRKISEYKNTLSKNYTCRQNIRLSALFDTSVYLIFLFSPLTVPFQTTQELIQTDGSHPSFFSDGISLLLSFSKTSCNASIWQNEQHKNTPCPENKPKKDSNIKK